MKLMFALVLFSSVALAAPTAPKKTLPIHKEEKLVNQKNMKAAVRDKKLNLDPEDCDDKAKKPIEIKEESISLTGNAGCTLPE